MLRFFVTHKIFGLLVLTILWPAAQIVIQIVRFGYDTEFGIFTMDIAIFAAIGLLSGYILYCFIKQDAYPALNRGAVCGYFLIMPFALGAAILAGLINAVLAIVIAVILHVVGTILGYLSGRIWVWATREKYS